MRVGKNPPFSGIKADRACLGWGGHAREQSVGKRGVTEDGEFA